MSGYPLLGITSHDYTRLAKLTPSLGEFPRCGRCSQYKPEGSGHKGQCARLRAELQTWLPAFRPLQPCDSRVKGSAICKRFEVQP
ncbi:hypothetical protein SAMN04488038_108191 [Solimonas aquatica]|uniref:Uncharacterized protein n=1 Tax=Solimonas aquatica TaxID=489703 RepID=A0A1H9HIL3_9GAMM|nr:hypothetical protein SAMN04488038_108191 [Solimonas aquatica]